MNPSDETEPLIDMAYDALEGAEDVMAYHARHGTPSLLVLTQLHPGIAAESARMIAGTYGLGGKTVIEIGAGVGFLAIELARYAKRVIAIEADPAWSWIFTRSLYAHKPANLSWIFGDAREFIGTIKGDVAVVFTRSGIAEMRDIAKAMAPVVVMPLHESGGKTPDFAPGPGTRIGLDKPAKRPHRNRP